LRHVVEPFNSAVGDQHHPVAASRRHGTSCTTLLGPMALIELKDKVAIASRGIGEAIALAFGDAGAQVVVSSRKLDGVEAVASKLRERGHQALALTAH